METDEDLSSDEQCDTKEKIGTRTILAFCVFGFLADFSFFVSLSASQDILEGTIIPSSLVLLAAAAPTCLTTVLYPFFFQRISVSLACCVTFTVSVAGMLTTSLVEEPKLKLVGVCLISFGIGNIETVFFPLSSLFGKSAVDGYALGSGAAFLAAPFSYIGLTMLACLSPEVSLLVLTALWILFPISYLVIKERSSSNHPTSYKEVPYIPFESDSNDTPEPKLSCNSMLSLVWKTQGLFIALFASIFSKQLLVSGVVTTKAFTDVPFTPRNQFLLYMFAAGTGDFLGKPYLGYFSLCGIQNKFVIRKTWILAFLNVSILIFMVFDSWFRLLTNLYVAAVLVLINSFLSGMVFANSFLIVGEGLSVEEKRFCRAFLTGAMATANVAVALIALDTETRLRENCLLFFPEGACYTRSRTEWNSTISCLL